MDLLFGTILFVLSGLAGLVAGYRTISVKTEAQLIQARRAAESTDAGAFSHRGSEDRDAADAPATDSVKWKVPKPRGYSQDTVVSGSDAKSTINDDLSGNLIVRGSSCKVVVNGNVFGRIIVAGADCTITVKGSVYNDATLGGYDNKLVIDGDARATLGIHGAGNRMLIAGNYSGEVLMKGRDGKLTVRGIVDAASRIKIAGFGNGFFYRQLLRGAVVTATGSSARQEQLR